MSIRTTPTVLTFVLRIVPCLAVRKTIRCVPITQTTAVASYLHKMIAA